MSETSAAPSDREPPGSHLSDVANMRAQPTPKPSFGFGSTSWRRAVRGGALAIALSGLAAPAFAETRTVQATAFHAIDASGPFRVHYSVGARPAVVVRGDVDRVRVRVVNGVLRITQRCNFICMSSKGHVAVIEASSPRLDRFEASQGVEGRAQGVTAQNFAARASMGGVLEIAGSCGRLDAKVSMGGVVSAEQMQCESVLVSASMGGMAEVHASDSVQASASMGGTIEVKGAPQERNASSTMGGSISVD